MVLQPEHCDVRLEWLTEAYAPQFRRADVLSVRRYGDFAVYSVDHYKALLFVRDATLHVVEQLKYLEQRLVVSFP
jgi:hypothetical protein